MWKETTLHICSLFYNIFIWGDDGCTQQEKQHKQQRTKYGKVMGDSLVRCLLDQMGGDIRRHT